MFSSTIRTKFTSSYQHHHTTLQKFTSIGVLFIQESYASSTACAKIPLSDAHQVFDEMPQRKQQVSEHTLSWDVFNVIQFVIRQQNASNTRTLHAFALKQGALTHFPTATSLLTAYSRCKIFSSSLALFNEVPERDVVLCNAMMSSCVENRRFDTAVSVFKKMDDFDLTSVVILLSAFSHLRMLQPGRVAHCLSIKAGMSSDRVLSNAAIDMYAKCGDLSSSENVFTVVECKDLVTWNSVITGSFFNNHPQKSLAYFGEMIACENEADSISISCALSACSSLHEFEIGKAIHCWAKKTGFTAKRYVSVANSLVSFYSHLRDICAAECVFSEIVVKNVVSCNAMIKGFFLNEESAKALSLLSNMQLVGAIEPDFTTVVTVIPFCAELMLLQEGKAAHGFSLRREIASETKVINSLINMYSKCGRVKEAEFLFAMLVEKDLVAWNSMISGYARNGLSSEAQTLFKKMMLCCSTLSLPTLLAIMGSCDSLQMGRLVHCCSIKMGFLCEKFAVNSLMHMYITCGALSDAVALLKITSIDVTSWNTLISGCVQNGHFLEALEFFNAMRKESRVYCSAVVLGSVLSACGNLGLSDEGKLIHCLALKTVAGTDIRVHNSLVTMYGKLGDAEGAESAYNFSNYHNLCSWNCVISAMSQNEDARKALELFSSLEFEPNQITISTVLSACTHLGAFSYGKQIHGHVFRVNFHQNTFVSAALTDMYSSCGRLDVAERVFLQSFLKSVTSWNSLISAYGFHSLGAKAIGTFYDMIRCGIRPTSGSFTSLLSACSHAGMVEEGRMFYESMLRRFNVVPSVEHHVCMVDMLGRSGRLNEAYDFVESLPGEPNGGVWGALLSACGYHGNVEMGRRVAEVLFELEPENVGYYVGMCNMYVAAGRWEEAVELRSVIQSKQLRKSVGYSFIDVGFR